MSFLEIFQPGLRYLHEERDRRRLMVAYPTIGGNPPIDIDLDAGIATIVIPAPTRGDSTDAVAETTKPTDHGTNSGAPTPDAHH